MQSGIRDTSVPFGNTTFDIVERALEIAASWTGRRRRRWLRHVFPFTSRRGFDASKKLVNAQQLQLQ
jgi:hypothetical protein